MKKSKVVLLLLTVLICFSIGCKSEPSSPKPQATNYTVTFNANGGSGTMPAQTFAKDETKALSANTFTMTNKVFTGWNTKADGTGTSYTDAQNYTATGNITLYAQWADVAFVVTFDKNDGSGEKVTQQFAAGTPQNLKANTFTITDKFFTGWNTKTDGTGTPYTDGQSYTATADITLYAQWRDPNIYTVTFNKNDGSGTTATQTFIEGKSQNLTVYGFGDIECGTFNSWNTQADGKGTSFEDEEEYTATATTTLYAQYDFEYLCFTAETANSTVRMEIAGTLTTIPTLEYSTDGFHWTDFVIGTTTVSLSNIKDKFYLRRKDANTTFSESSSKYLQFAMTGQIAASGNIMSLLDKTCELETLESKSYCFIRLFYHCSSLTTAPELPATTLGENCYSHMFLGCTSLTEAPELPATVLARSCYSEMFRDCTLLTGAPTLSATTLAFYCYQRMFQGCTSLTEAPVLPATTLLSDCYYQMFYGCTLLTEAPELPATTLVESCYQEMFRECVSLTEAPELPATTLKKNCYEGMFQGCTSLTEAPALPATTLAERCYWNMFIRSSLTEAPALPATTLESGCYEAMFKSCTSLIETPTLPATTLAERCYQEMFLGCTSLTEAPELPATTLKKNCYYSMFKNCTSLTEAPILPVTTLAESCYQEMFSGCISLTEAPTLPATTLAESCYHGMFRECVSLIEAPELPATTLAKSCYSGMFAYTLLTEAPTLPATTLTENCYYGMFQSCTSLIEAPTLPATTLKKSCYNSMFQYCTSLTEAPELPATNLVDSCYAYMFRGCTSLKSIKVYLLNWVCVGDSSVSGTDFWVRDVSYVGTFKCRSYLSQQTGENRIPEGWAIETF